MDYNKNPWKTTSSKNIYDNPWINITEHQVINPNGGEGIYGKIHFKNLAIGIVVLDEEDQIWLVGQYRYPLEQYSWEIPEGGGPHDVDPLDSAKRELLEETGVTAKLWFELMQMHLSNSVSDEKGFIYLAQNLTYGDSEPEETEQLELKKVPFEKAYQMVMNGEITDSMSVAGIMKVKLLKLQGKLL